MGLFDNREEELKKELKKKNKELKRCKDKRELFEEIVEISSFPIYKIDQDLKFKYVNEAGREFVGADSTEDLVGLKFEKIFGDIKEDVKSYVKKALEEKEIVENEEVMATSKSQKIVNISIRPTKNTKGNITGALVLLENITDEKKRKEYYNALVENRNIPSCLLSKQGEIMLVNEAMKKALDLEKEKIEGKNIRDILGSENVLVKRVLKNKKKITNEHQRFEVGEEEKHFLASASFIDEPSNSYIVLVTFQNVTRQKRVESELKKLRNKYETLVENAPLSISIADLDDNLLYVNDYMAEKLGYSVEELEGQSLMNFLPEEEIKKLKQKTEKRKEEDDTETYELKFEKKDGSLIEMMVNATPMKNEEGEIVKTVGFLQDISDIKELQREQEETRKYLEEQVDKILEGLDKIQQGDLTVKIEKEKDDNIGKLIDGINRMADEFRESLMKIQNSAEELNEASDHIASSSEEVNAVTENVSNSMQNISSGISEQTRMSEELSEKVEESVSSIEETSASADDIAASAEEVAAKTEEGMSQAEEASEKVDDLQTKLDETAEKAFKLDELSDQIGEVIETISGIAEQTNLLALNASIEAARAGEHGKGFAVVADSVRELAEETQEETENIKEIIEETQINASDVVEGVKEVEEKSQEVNEATKENYETLENIGESTRSVSESIQQINDAMDELAEDLQEASNRIEQVAEISEQNAQEAESSASTSEEQTVSIEELSASAQQLSDLSAELKKIVDEYKIEELNKDTENV